MPNDNRLVLKMDVSVDGFVATHEREVDWFTSDFDDEIGEHVVELLRGASVHLMGSRLYGDMSAYWPGPGRDEIYGPPMNETPKAVASRSLAESDLDWGPAEILAGDLTEEIDSLRERDGGYVLAHGGSQLAGELSRLGLVDEYHLIVHPIALGEGLPLFSGRTEMQRTGFREFANGTVVLTLTPRG